MNSPKKVIFLRSQKFKATILFFSVVVLFLGLTWPVLAAQIDTGLQYGSYTGLGTQDLRISIMKIVRIALGFVGVIVITLIVYAGFIWMTSAGNEEKIDKAKKIITNAIIGLAIILMAVAIVSFIIRMLQGSLGGGQVPSQRPPSGCENCSNLGTGILESVYPAPFAQDVARNTSVIVTFKVNILASTLIQEGSGDSILGNCSASGCDTLKEGAVKIYKYDDGAADRGESLALPANQVRVATNDNKTFTFRLASLFDAETWYQVKLTNEIKIDNEDQDPAFSELGNYFAWRFKIGNSLDLDPPEISTVFPQPDSFGDSYTETSGAYASGRITVNGLPSVGRVASWQDLEKLVATSPDLSILDSYNGTLDARICVSADDNNILIRQLNPGSTDCNGAINPSPTCFADNNVTTVDVFEIANTVPESGSGTVNIGCGLRLQFTGRPRTGNLWTFKVLKALEPNNLKINNRTYTFVSGTPSGNQIQAVAGSATAEKLVQQAGYIWAKIKADKEALALGPTSETVPSGNVINLRANLAGEAGNNIPIQATGSWFNIEAMSGGQSAGMNGTTRDIEDKPRNAIVTFDFNEAVLPTEITGPTPGACAGGIRAGKACSDNSQCPSSTCTLNSNLNVVVEYLQGSNWVKVPGEVLAGSNEYKSVDFIPESLCQICQGGSRVGLPCSSSSDCGSGGTCAEVSNSCGDKIHCLPVSAGSCSLATSQSCFSNQDCPSGETCNYQATKYRIRLRAGLLKTCTENENCSEASFATCTQIDGGTGATPKACQGEFTNGINAFYPEANLIPNGIVDVASNSFNGNNDSFVWNGKTFGKADGPGYFFASGDDPGHDQSGQPAYPLNRFCSNNPQTLCQRDSDCGTGTCTQSAAGLGDNSVWYFFVNKDLDLTPPQVVTVRPNIGGIDVSLKAPIESTFDDLLMSSTLKPGANYRDGSCACTSNGQCDEDAGEICDTDTGFCKNQSTEVEPNYCWKDEDCKVTAAGTCHNKKYLTLIDQLYTIGWWVSHLGLENPSLTDGFADWTQAQLQHTTLAEVNRYGMELGSGIKDVYQNCYLPSSGPSVSNKTCLNPEDFVQFGTGCISDRECLGNSSACPNNNCYCVNVCEPANPAAGCCPVTRLAPYCCNGVAQTKTQWEQSSCYTGY